MKRALITGITGQDGSYLAEMLLEKGYEVHGLVRRSSTQTTWRIDGILDRVKLHEGDLGDQSSLSRVVEWTNPDEIYNLAAQTHVGTSFQTAEYTGDVTGIGVARLLEAVRASSRPRRFYQASTSELYGNAPAPQGEGTPMIPRSPYGAAKLYAHAMTRIYREAYGVFACSGILFNHESARRGELFVSKKITKAAVRIKLGLQDKLVLGDLSAKRDWGHAKDYMRAVWMMLQREEPEDFVIATGETHTVLEFVERAFGRLDLDYRKYVEVDSNLFRPAEVNVLRGNAEKARTVLGWTPEVHFEELVAEMVDADLAIARGHKTEAAE